MYRPETLNEYGLSHFDENAFMVSSPTQWCMVMNHLHGLSETTTMTLGGHSQALRFHAPLAFDALTLLVSSPVETVGPSIEEPSEEVVAEDTEEVTAPAIDEFDDEAGREDTEADGE